MLTTWEFSSRSEAERLIHCARQIVVGFYKSNGFTVLPFIPNQDNSKIVSFPDLAYNTIPRFWDQVRKINVDSFPLVIETKLLDSVTALIESSHLPSPEYSKLAELWAKAESDIIAKIYEVLPSKKDIIKNIFIHPTSFGTSCSFNQIEDNGDVIIYLRQGGGIHTIVEAIITVLTRNDIYSKLSGLWSESEMITDFLVTESAIATVLQKYESVELYNPTIKNTRLKEIASLTQQSNDFYKKLGLPNFEAPFAIVDNSPRLFQKPLDVLSASESNLIRVLIENQNQVVDFDTIGTMLFKNEDDFSLFAISKTIQRLRDKLESMGISGSYIQTLRGKGYLLKN